MYHIANDIRAKKSADLIIQGLEKCLEEKPLDKIKINDIYNKTYVSRSTFYRLFDSINDVLSYECDCLRDETIKSLENIKFNSKKDLAIHCLKMWIQHETLVKAIVENRLYGLLYDVHMRHKEDLQKLYSANSIDDDQLNYLVSFIVSILFCSYNVYYKKNKEKSVEELVDYTDKMISTIVNIWSIGK